jgi:hypothetical protein
MAPRKKSSRNRDNPSTVLVLFMVFFILLSIGLGVGTYYGYAGQKKLEEDAINARKEAKAARNAEDYYKFQALTARGAAGPLVKSETIDEPNDWMVAMEGFEDGSKFKEEKTRPAIEELVKAMKKELGWNAAEKKFATTWAEKVKKQEADLKNTQASLQLAMDQKKKAEADLLAVETKNETYWKDVKNDIEKKNAEVLAAAREKRKEMTDAQADNKKLEDQKEALQRQLEKIVRAKDKEIALMKETTNEQQARYAALKKQFDQQAAAVAAVSSSLVVGDFAGKWAGTLMRGGAVDLEIKADGTVYWSVPGIAKEIVPGVSRLEKDGENYVVSIQNQPVRLFLANDRRTLRLVGPGLEVTLNRK